MKQQTHPVYRETIFKDISSDLEILTRTTMPAKDTIKWKDGKEYPMIKVEISSASHPYFTGQHRLLDSEGRVEKFLKRYNKREIKK
jgi:large subunit ribosomal protein L31